MSVPQDQRSERSAIDANSICPARVAGLRAMAEEELDQLVTALEKPVDRDHLEHWVATAISNAVKLSSLPSPRQAREGLKRIASSGREWIRQIESDPIKDLLTQKALQEGKGSIRAVAEHSTKVQELKVAMARICEQADSTAASIGRFIRRGGQRSTSPALTDFVDNMIGVAKWNGIWPSTPQRAMYSRKPPAFFVFVRKALSTAQEVIKTSEIPDRRKKRAIRSLRYRSRDALIRILERRRGLISNYRKSHHGRLVEDTSRRRKAVRARHK